MTLKPVVLDAETGRLLRWRGHLLFRGLFDATHEFVLEATPRGTYVTQRERLTGVLVPLLGAVVKRTERDNARADAGLKAHVEASA